MNIKLCWIFGLLPLAVTVCILPTLPDQVPLMQEMEFVMCSKYKLLIAPMIGLLFAAVFHLEMRRMHKQMQAMTEERNIVRQRVRIRISIITALLGLVGFDCFWGVSFYSTLHGHWPFDPIRMMAVYLAITLIVMGNQLPRTTICKDPIPSKWKEANEDTCRVSNRITGWIITICGLLMLPFAFLLEGISLFIVTFAAILIACFFAYLTSEICYRRYQTKDKT